MKYTVYENYRTVINTKSLNDLIVLDIHTNNSNRCLSFELFKYQSNGEYQNKYIFTKNIGNKTPIKFFKYQNP